MSSKITGVWLDEIGDWHKAQVAINEMLRFRSVGKVQHWTNRWDPDDAPDPIADIRTAMDQVLDAPMRPWEPIPVHPRSVPRGWLPVRWHIARLLPAPRPPAEVARQHALLNPTVED